MTIQEPLDIREIAYYNEIAIHRDWHVQAHRALAQLANAGTPFTADDFREAMGDTKPKHHNAIGSLFRVASKDGLITPTGKFVQSRTSSRHAAAIREWVGTPANTMPTAA